MPFMMTIEASAEKPDEVHPHVAGLVDVKALGKSHPIILISDHEAPLFLKLQDREILVGNPAGWAYFNELEMSSAVMSPSDNAFFAGSVTIRRTVKRK